MSGTIDADAEAQLTPGHNHTTERNMTQPGGILTVDGRRIGLTHADCSLFAGCLDFDFHSPEVDGTIHGIPVGDAVEFSQLHGFSVSIEDCSNIRFENSICKPCVSLGHEFYSVRSLHVEGITHRPDNHFLCATLNATAIHEEDSSEISVSAEFTAECIEITAADLLLRSESIPVRFAKHYLPLVGLPAIEPGVGREEIVSLFGPPDYGGGGMHPRFGQIPIWSRYKLPNLSVRFEFESDLVTNVMIASHHAFP